MTGSHLADFLARQEKRRRAAAAGVKRQAALRSRGDQLFKGMKPATKLQYMRRAQFNERLPVLRSSLGPAR